MKRAVLFAFTFLLTAGLGASLGGCYLLGDCECLSTPPRPAAQPPVTHLEVSFGGRSRPAAAPVKPENGTAEVTGDTVVFVYRQGGAEHRVVYEVTGPR